MASQLEGARRRKEDLLQQGYDLDAKIEALRDKKRELSKELNEAVMQEEEAAREEARAASSEANGQKVVPVNQTSDKSEGRS